jgi:chemotaxis protein MotA
MFIIIGIAAVVFAVLTGFLIAGGNLILLLQYAEFIVIVGAAVGGLLISAPLSLLKKVLTEIPKLLKPDHYSKEDYLLLLKSFNDLFVVAQRDGLLSIEKHIENPDQSDILSKNPKFINNSFIRNFFCDTLKVMLSGGVPPHELEGLMDVEIETFEIESKPVAATVARVGDSLPGLGIVAAVLGIIITMSSIDQGAQVVGEHVAAALVGTFLGVLLAYGFVNPVAAALEHDAEIRLRLLQTIKACVVAYAKGNPPIISVEIGRRTIFSDERPTFSELESYIRSKTNVGT